MRLNHHFIYMHTNPRRRWTLAAFLPSLHTYPRLLNLPHPSSPPLNFAHSTYLYSPKQLNPRRPQYSAKMVDYTKQSDSSDRQLMTRRIQGVMMGI